MNGFTLLALASIAISACLAYPHHEGHHGEGEGKDTFAPAHYTFEYGVHDPHSKDVKSQHEHRDGDSVKGEYTVQEPDGTKRVVEYTADKHHGFQAVVKRIGHAQHPHVYGDHKGHGEGGTSYVGITHWGHGSGR